MKGGLYAPSPHPEDESGLPEVSVALGRDVRPEHRHDRDDQEDHSSGRLESKESTDRRLDSQSESPDARERLRGCSFAVSYQRTLLVLGTVQYGPMGEVTRLQRACEEEICFTKKLCVKSFYML